MLLDSNIIIYSILPQYSFLQKYISWQHFVSIISKVEVLGYHQITPNQIKNFTLCFDNLNVLNIDGDVIEKAIEIRQSKALKLGDSIVAATALINNFTIITRNEADFKNIPGLQVVNPFTI